MLFTNSKDGQQRATIQIKYRVSKEDLTLVCACLLYEALPEEKITKNRIVEQVRHSLTYNGTNGIDRYYDKGFEDELEIAKKIIAKLF